MANSKFIPNSIRTEENSKSRQAEFEILSKELADKELELATLENELAIFERRYARIIGVLFAELDELERQIAEELLRLHPGEISRIRFEEAAKRARTSRDSFNEKLKKAVNLDFSPSEDLKSVFRRVAKTVHPDLSTNEEERSYRTKLMAKANIAYRNGDKKTLEQILIEWEDWLSNTICKEAQSNELNQLDKKILQVKMHLFEIGKKIDELKKSELFRLMRKVEIAEQQGDDLLGDMAKDLQQQIQTAKVRLESLKRQRK
jgi:hypothetical protein